MALAVGAPPADPLVGWRPPDEAARRADGAPVESRLRIPLVEDFLTDGSVEDNWSPKTVLTYRQVLNGLALWAVRETQQPFSAALLGRELLRDWQRHLRQDRRYDDATYVKYLATLRSFLAHLHEHDLTTLAATPTSPTSPP
jgi:site-specific recombinase XerD